jgi:hypothetical protein
MTCTHWTERLAVIQIAVAGRGHYDRVAGPRCLNATGYALQLPFGDPDQLDADSGSEIADEAATPQLSKGSGDWISAG